MAVTAVSTVPWPEMTTTGSSGSISFRSDRISRPSRSEPLSQTSSTTRRGARVRIGRKGVRRIARRANREPLVLQDAANKFADIGFVIDHQDFR